MKNIISTILILALVTISCTQKTKDVTKPNSEMMKNDTTNLNDASTKKMMTEKKFACPMHPQIQGKLNDKCSKCGMPLTEPVPEKAK